MAREGPGGRRAGFRVDGEEAGSHSGLRRDGSFPGHCWGGWRMVEQPQRLLEGCLFQRSGRLEATSGLVGGTLRSLRRWDRAGLGMNSTSGERAGASAASFVCLERGRGWAGVFRERVFREGALHVNPGSVTHPRSLSRALTTAGATRACHCGGSGVSGSFGSRYCWSPCSIFLSPSVPAVAHS